MEYLELISIPGITLVCYWIIYCLKKAINNETFSRCIPLVSCALGAVIGIICFYFVPGITPTNNALIALLLGGASGLSATGTNQIIKQLTSKKDEGQK